MHWQLHLQKRKISVGMAIRIQSTVPGEGALG
jgi:hypothetical protein